MKNHSTSILYIPEKINKEDLNANQLLLEDNILNHIKRVLKKDPSLSIGKLIKISKKNLHQQGIKSPYSIYVEKKSDNDFNIFIIYKGIKQGKHLGVGTFGAVKLAQSVNDKAFYAVKIQATKSEDEALRQEKEKNKLEKLDELVGELSYQPASEKKYEKYQTAKVFILKLISGQESAKLINENYNFFSMPQRMTLCKEALGNLKKIHANDIVHCDIKPENIMYDPLSKTARIIDFGLSLDADGQGIAYAPSFNGTILYLEPDLRKSILSVEAYKPRLRDLEQKLMDLDDQLQILMKNEDLAHVKSDILEIERKIDDEKAELNQLKKERMDLYKVNKVYSMASDVYSMGVSLVRYLKCERYEQLPNDKPHYAFDANELNRNPYLTTEVKIALTDLLLKMIDPDPNKRPNMTIVEKDFNDIYEHYIETLPRQLKSKVAIVNMHDLFELMKRNNEIEDAPFFRKLLGADCIQLVNTKPYSLSNHDEVKLKQDLENYGLKVKSAIIHTPHIETVINASSAIENNQLISTDLKSDRLTSSIKMLKMIDIPTLIDIKELKPNGQLLSAKIKHDILRELKSSSSKITMQNQTTFRLTKKELNHLGIDSHYSIIVKKIGDEFKIFTIYKGEKHKKDLGRGAMGGVKLVQDTDTGEFYAYKRQIAPIKPEADKLEKVQQLVATFSYTPMGERKKTFYAKNESSVAKRMRLSKKRELQVNAVITPIARGKTLTKLKADSLSGSEIMQMFSAIAKSLDKVHQQDIIHADLKPDNIFYDPLTKKATLIDFGIALNKTRGEDEVDSMIAGTANYLPPEFRRNQAIVKFHPKTDIASLAITFAEMLGFVKDSKNEKYYELINVDDPQFSTSTIINVTLRKSILDFLHLMFDEPKENRPSLKEVDVFFKDLAAKLTIKQTSKIAILDAKDFSPQNSSFSSLQSFDRVILVYSEKKPNIISVLALKKALEKQGIKVSDEVFHNNSFNNISKNYLMNTPFKNAHFYKVSVDKDHHLIQSRIYLAKSGLNIFNSEASNVKDKDSVNESYSKSLNLKKSFNRRY